MSRTSANCPHCAVRLNIGTRGLFLDAKSAPTTNWRRAAWKTCSECSTVAKVHVFLRFPDAYSGDGTRTLESGEVVPQDRCRFHRDYAKGNDGNAGKPPRPPTGPVPRTESLLPRRLQSQSPLSLDLRWFAQSLETRLLGLPARSLVGPMRN
jgi:hypothetical protein